MMYVCSLRTLSRPLKKAVRARSVNHKGSSRTVHTLRIIIRYVEAIVGFLRLVGASDDAVPVPSVLILRMVNEWME